MRISDWSSDVCSSDLPLSVRSGSRCWTTPPTTSPRRPPGSPPMSEASWAIIVHGGAKTIKSALHQRNRDGCLAAAEAGAALLPQGGSALAAAEAAVRVLEDNPLFNAGFGSVLTAAGAVGLDAAAMTGPELARGACAAVRRPRP